MALFEGIYDIAMDADGDLIISNGDIKVHNGLDWFISEVTKIIRTTNPEWRSNQNVGASLEDFIGQPNTRETAGFIEERLYDKITAENIHIPGTLDVRVTPLSKSSISVLIRLLVQGEVQPITKIIFDFEKGNIKVQDDNEQPVQPKTQRPYQESSNPYLSRIR